MREHLLASVAAGGEHGLGRELADELDDALRPGGGRVLGKPDDVNARDAVRAEPRGRLVEGDRLDRAAEAARERERLERELAGLDEDQNHDTTPKLTEHLDHARRGLRAVPEHLDDARLLHRHHEAHLLEPRLPSLRRMGLELGLLRPQPAGQRGEPRQVDPLLDRDHGGSGTSKTSQPPAASPPRDRQAAVDLDPLDPGHAGQAERRRDAHRHLVAAGVRRLVAEQQQVEASLRHRVGDRGGGRGRVELLAVRLQQDPGADPHRERVSQLLGRGRGPERRDGRRAAVRLDEPQRLLDRALLVRAIVKPR